MYEPQHLKRWTLPENYVEWIATTRTMTRRSRSPI
jgi:hypothetical protein